MTTGTPTGIQEFGEVLAAPELEHETKSRLLSLLQGLNSTAVAHNYNFDIRKYAPACMLMDVDPIQFRALLLLLIEPFLRLLKQKDDWQSSLRYRLGQWLVLAMRNKQCLDEYFLTQVTEHLHPSFESTIRELAKAYIGRLEKFHEKPGFSPALREKVAGFHAAYSLLEKKYPEKECQALLDRLAALITNQEEKGEDTDQPLFDDLVGSKEWFIRFRPLMPRVEWPSKIEADIAEMDMASSQSWRAFWRHAATAKSSAPGQKWLKSARELMTAIGSDFGRRTVGWIELIIAGTPKGELPFSDRNAPMVKGLMWASSLGKEDELAASIGNMVRPVVPTARPRQVQHPTGPDRESPGRSCQTARHQPG